MDTSALKKFAQAARRQLLEQVTVRMEQVFQSDSVEIREKVQAVNELQEQIHKTSKEAVIDQVAYTWFNRLCALRFMDANHYTRIGIVSPVEGFTQPEILQEAKQGVIDGSFKVDKKGVIGLLNGQLPASNPQQEAYRLLLVGACNAYHQEMPFLFPKINDYTELLMPDDLLSENSVLQAVRETLTPEVCQDVEVIGWLYQFYISEKKDTVMARKSAVPSEEIPAVTQLFTPHYIVCYLVENSLGRLWMLNHPDSKLVEQMEYYIKPEQEKEDFLKIGSPEEIKVCDPACGSGHMLTYAFDLLGAMYAEEGYDALQIPSLILKHNLFGIEIDERAGQLAAFALTMKAREKDQRFFSRGVEPNICVMENVSFTASEIKTYMEKVGTDLFTQTLREGLQQFEDAKTFGSLIRPKITNPQEILSRMKERGAFEDLFLNKTNEKVQIVLEMVEYLSSHYHVVIANPPYMGSGGMNEELKNFAKDQYPDSKSDLGVTFIERNLDLVRCKGVVGMITLMSWMFLSSFENLRNQLIEKITIINMAHLGARAFDTIGGAVVSTTMFTILKAKKTEFKGAYLRLIDGSSEFEKQNALREGISNPDCGWFFRASIEDFKKIPGSPIVYWVSKKIYTVFQDGKRLKTVGDTRQGMATSDNKRFLRFWHEVDINKISFYSKNHFEAKASKKKWFPYNKGGAFRKWFGNAEFVVNWENEGEELLNYAASLYGSPTRTIKSISEYFKNSISWSKISSGNLAMRYYPSGFIFDVAGCCIFLENKEKMFFLLGFSNSNLARYILSAISPTLNFEAGHIASLPIIEKKSEEIYHNIRKLIEQSEDDWNSCEISWGFTKLPLVNIKEIKEDLSNIYKDLYSDWKVKTLGTQLLEETNNRFFNQIYDLEDEISSDIPLKEITLTCNPYYRYNSKKSEEELDALLLADTMKEFISYSVGCMFGRYSLDKEGLILANAGETLQDYLKQVTEPTFVPDEDNVIPVLEGEWFEDDITERFKDFLKVTFGEAHFSENLDFLEEAIGRDIRDYFVKDFYKEHVQMYKKRPIYWMFSSPNGSFNVLIYMHSYRPDTLSVILNDYLVQYRGKLNAHKAMLEARGISASASQSEKTKALKEVDQINTVLSELKEYEDEILYPLATQQIEIDLDDGVKVNYIKFGKALKEVAGLSEKP